ERAPLEGRVLSLLVLGEEFGWVDVEAGEAIPLRLAEPLPPEHLLFDGNRPSVKDPRADAIDLGAGRLDPKRALLEADPKPAQSETHHSSVAGHPLALEEEEALAGDARSVGHEVRSPRTKMIGAASDLLPIRDEAVEKRVAHLLARLERTSGRDGV